MDGEDQTLASDGVQRRIAILDTTHARHVGRGDLRQGVQGQPADRASVVCGSGSVFLKYVLAVPCFQSI